MDYATTDKAKDKYAKQIVEFFENVGKEAKAARA
jgi:hypothetical protein